MITIRVLSGGVHRCNEKREPQAFLGNIIRDRTDEGPWDMYHGPWRFIQLRPVSLTQEDIIKIFPKVEILNMRTRMLGTCGITDDSMPEDF